MPRLFLPTVKLYSEDETQLYKPKPRETVEEIAENMIALATLKKSLVTANIKGITLVAHPSNNPYDIVLHWQAESKRGSMSAKDKLPSPVSSFA